MKKSRGQKFFYSSGTLPHQNVCLDDKVLEIIHEVYAKYGDKNDTELRAIVYMTEPMKYLLKLENEGKNVSRIPVLYNDKEAQEIE
jgi:hypothetical protein